MTRETFDRGMAWLEAVKRDSFTRETLEAWFTDMIRSGVGDDEFREKVLFVGHTTTYGKVTLDQLVNAESLFTRTDVERIINQRVDEIIKARADELRRRKVSEDDILRMGMGELSKDADFELRLKIEGFKKRVKPRIRAARAFVRIASEDVAVELWKSACKMGIVRDVNEPFWREILPVIVPKYLPVVESMMKRMGAGIAR